MPRAALLLAACLLLAGCADPTAVPATAPARPPAADAAYGAAARGLDSTLQNSVNADASRPTLTAEAEREAAVFAAAALHRRASGGPSWAVLAQTSHDLTAWAGALQDGDGERADTAVLALWRDQKALPPCA
jgi:hypothetical protein